MAEEQCNVGLCNRCNTCRGLFFLCLEFYLSKKGILVIFTMFVRTADQECSIRWDTTEKKV